MMQAGSTTQSECACCVRSFSWLKGISLREKSCCMKTEALCCFLMLYRLCCWIWWLKAHSVPFVASAGHGLVNVCIHWMKLYKGDQRSLHTCFQSGCSFPFGFCNAPCLIMYACLPLCRMKPWMLQQPGGIDRFKGSCQVVIRRSWRNLLSSAHAYHASLVKCKKKHVWIGTKKFVDAAKNVFELPLICDFAVFWCYN